MEEDLKKIIKRRKIYEILTVTQALIFVFLSILVINLFENIDFSKRITERVITGETEGYNSKFEGYSGEITGTSAKTLIKLTNSHNENQVKKENLIYIKVLEDKSLLDGDYIDIIEFGSENWNKENIEKSNNAVFKSIRAGYTYNVSFLTDKNSGNIIQVNIKRI